MRIVELASLTDSRIQYEKRPPLFGLLLLALTAAAIVAALVWSSTTPRPSVVEGAGVVEGANRSLVMSSVSGRVVEVAAPNGSDVAAGDRLLAVESVEIDVEKQTVASQRALLQRQLDLQSRYSAAVRSGTNAFDRDVPEEAAFYWQFESLRSQKEQLRPDRPSLEAIGYTPEEIENVEATNRLKAAELDSTALGESSGKEAQFRQQIAELDIREGAAVSSEGAYEVSAPVAGTVYLNEIVTVGSVVTAGQSIGSVASTAAGVDVSVYLTVPDRQHVAVGDEATVTVSGLPSAEYRTVTGRIVSIDADVTTLPEGTSERTTGYFVAHLDLSDDAVTSTSGEQRALLNGTAITATVVYDEVTYLEYIGELVGVLR